MLINRPAHQLHPFTDHDSDRALQRAMATLGALRSLDWPDDAGAALHLLVSLTRQADAALPQAITHARAQHYTFDQIRALLGVHPPQ